MTYILLSLRPFLVGKACQVVNNVNERSMKTKLRERQGKDNRQDRIDR